MLLDPVVRVGRPAQAATPAFSAPETHAFQAPRSSPLHQNRMHSGPGADLRQACRALRKQADPAAEAGCCVLAARQAEAGTGMLSVFLSLAAAWGLEIGGRSLPPGGHLGTRLLALRRRLKIGRRPVAMAAGLSPTTVPAVEAGADCHAAAAFRLAEALGIRLRRRPAGNPASAWGAAGTLVSFMAEPRRPRRPGYVSRTLGQVAAAVASLSSSLALRAGPRTRCISPPKSS